MSIVDQLKGLPGAAERAVRRYPITERHFDALQRANALRFTRWAAGMALFGYLALFPLAVLAAVALSVLLASVPEAQQAAEEALADALSVNGLLNPSQTVDIESLANSTKGAGLVGAVGLLIAGLGWVDATLEGVRRMLGALRRPRPWIQLRLEDAAWLIAVGSVLLVALMVTVGVRSLGEWVLGELGWELHGSWVVRLSGDGLALLLVWLVLISIYGFCWARPRRMWRAVMRGSLLAVVGIAVLAELAFLVVGRTLSNPVYGALAVAAALLLLLYFASTIVMYCACWVAVREGAPEALEQQAYFGRMKAGGVELPIKAAASADAVVDGSSDEGQAGPPDTHPK
jgi:membrane protein